MTTAVPPALAALSRVETTDPALSSRVDAAIDAALADRRLVGAVVLVAQDGQAVYRRAAGLADREARRPMREDAIFHFSSLTKPIVTAAALRLVEEGRIALEDPVTKYLPDFRPKLADGTEPVITLGHLLLHTAGMTYTFNEPVDGPYHQAQVSSGLDYPGLSIEDNLRRIASVPLSFAPGTAWTYSVSLDVLGPVLAKAAGQSLPDLVRDRVTGPLGLQDTGFAPPDLARLATPYIDGRPEPTRMAADDVTSSQSDLDGIRYSPGRIFDGGSYPSGGAGMAGTAGDFLVFLEALRQGGAPILKRETTEAMGQNQIPGLVREGSPGDGFGYGFAVFTDPVAAGVPQAAGSWHWGGVYGHTWSVDPVNRLTVVILTNTAIEGMAGQLKTDVLAAVYDQK